MALSMSTALKNYLLEHGSLKSALLDGVLRIYSGTRPSNADSSIGSATLLVSITLNSGAYTEGDPSSRLTIFVPISGSPNSGTIRFSINGTNYDYTEQNSASLDDNLISMSVFLARKFLPVIVTPVLSSSGATGLIFSSKFEGETFSLTAVQMGSGFTVGSLQTFINNNRKNGLHLGSSLNGTITKEAQTWSGTAVASGTATWFRIQGSELDDDTARTDLIRLDGSVGTSNADLILSSISITSGTTVTIDGCSFTLP